MTDAVTTNPVRLIADHSFFAEDGSLREWAAGEVVYDADEIATLKARGTPSHPTVTSIDAAFVESVQFISMFTERGRRLAAALVAAAVRSGSITVGTDYETTLAAVNSLDAVVRAALDRFIVAARRDIAELQTAAVTA